VQGGGVGIYVKTGLSFSHSEEFSIFYDRVFDSIFIELSLESGKKITVGSCYRPNIHTFLTGNEQFNNFMDIFSLTFAIVYHTMIPLS